jgi:hypothetical protein
VPAVFRPDDLELVHVDCEYPLESDWRGTVDFELSPKSNSSSMNSFVTSSSILSSSSASPSMKSIIMFSPLVYTPFVRSCWLRRCAASIASSLSACWACSFAIAEDNESTFCFSLYSYGSNSSPYAASTAASKAASNSASVSPLGARMCFRRTPCSVSECTEDVGDDGPDSSMVSSHDIEPPL